MNVFCDRIAEADTTESLDSLSHEVEELRALTDNEKSFIRRLLATRRELVVQTLRTKGEYFVEAKHLYEIKFSGISTTDATKSFDLICRQTTPSYYAGIKEASETKTAQGSLRDPWLQSLGTNSRFEKGKRDIFNNSIDPVKAHIFLDSKACAPGWGHMAEGATGKIEGSITEEEKNKVRLLRMMGSNADKENCLRYDVHNFITLQASHRVYFDGEPQLLVIPLLPLEAIKDWDGNTAYDVLILAAAPADTGDAARNGTTAAEIYKAILCDFDWATFDDENNDSAGTCSPEEVRTAFSVLGNFVEAMAHSLISEIPQTLIKQATKRDSVNNGEKINKKKNNQKKNNQKKNKKPPASPPMATLAEGEEVDGDSLNTDNTTKPLWWNFQELINRIRDDGGVRLPCLSKNTQEIGRALKLRLNAEPGRPVPDPWGLMAKAAVNYSYIEYGCKILPACKPPPHESQLEYEVALRLHECRARQQDIPSSLIVPVTPLTPAANLGADSARIVTPERETEESERGWEYFTD